MILSFTSFGGKVDTLVNQGSGPYCFRVGGQVHHRMGNLLPTDCQTPKFAQLYICDTENEVDHRLGSISSTNKEDMLDPNIIQSLKDMLDEHNSIAQSFRYARDRYNEDILNGVRLRLIRRRSSDGRVYNLPSASEVAALIVGDIDGSMGDRDIIVETRNRVLQRLDVQHPLYLGMQYPLSFPYGEDGYRDDVQRNIESSGRTKPRATISMREFFSFRLQTRSGESQILHHSRRLFQQFLVDAYTMIEHERLSFIRHNQDHLKADLYQNVIHAFNRGEDAAAKTGKRIIIPSSFTGGPRYMTENCKDAFAICRWAGYPYLFITITCNPKWPKISRFLNAKNLKPEDRPDILCRVFKFKLDQLLNDLRKEHFLGRVNAYVCTIEFQKRGLPHAHILLFLHPSDKPNSGIDIDKLISAEIPNKDTHSSLFSAVNTYMMHGPCDPDNYNSPCMKDGNCSKKFPKNFCSRTFIDDDEFPHYKRNNDCTVVNKNGVELDNRYVVSYNAKLLLKYQAHINVEYTCQSKAIKYLFKYIHKGNDRVTAAIHHSNSFSHSTCTNDEIKMFYDCRYVSACEAAWRIFGFDVHWRYPTVQRLSFYLPNQKNIVFSHSASISDVKTRAKSRISMFESWMEENKKNSEGRDLTYAEYPTYFAYKEDTQEWHPRKKGFLIGRINQFSANNGEDSYLRLLLTFQKGYAVLTEESIKNTTLAEIDKVLQSNERCLSDYPSTVNLYFMCKIVWKNIFLEYPVRFFRSNGEIILNVASSGIASLLLPGGQTAYSRFRIPIHITEDSTCNIT
ncbi:uncharacterized protein LOC133314138 [Gastrolobium bilobum]|uniref:uncharacterized protein LOC133314138 n=1 Tax=Gastrolobium bilobum TaxID=150636 RepID=UPI002AAF77A2|nr:uncharacterized protein LOC133314138 [Gastrolobium bilobum]